MIDNVLEAYENVLKKKYPLKNIVRNLNVVSKIFLGITIVGAVLIAILLLINSIMAIMVEVAWLLVIYLFSAFLVSMRRKQWQENIEQYNEVLDILKDVLYRKEFDLYEKNKMKQLKRKLQQEIDEEEYENEKKKQNRLNFFQTFFLPVITFICGAITRDKNVNDLVTLGILIIIFMVGFYWAKATIIDFHAQINGNVLYRKKRMLKHLQDLIDREFEILDVDLL